MKKMLRRLSDSFLRSGALLVFYTMPAIAGVGMTMPVNPPAESCSLNITSTPTVPSPVTQLLPLDGYKPPQVGGGTINPLNGADTIFSSCNKSWASCPSSGTISEQDGRLNSFLRGYSASQDAKYILASAVWTQLGLTIPGNPNISTCGADSNANCATAMAQLAVTGRHAFNTFSTWDPSITNPNARGPQVADLDELVTNEYTAKSPQLLPTGFSATIPPLSSQSVTIVPAALAQAENAVLQQAYTALWAIRANDSTWRKYRQGAGWIAVSGEDDTPHRPVNVVTAPFAQFDIPVPVIVNGQSFSLVTRYSLMSLFTSLGTLNLCSSGCLPQTPTPVPAPSIPAVITPCETDPGGAPHPPHLCQRFELPPQDPTSLLTELQNQSKIVPVSPRFLLYIHGGGSRLEEADGLAQQLILQSSAGQPIVVISVDLPNSAYADTTITSIDPPAFSTSLDASSAMFENGPNGSTPANIESFPVLNFEINFINSFVAALAQNNIIDPTEIAAVMGGSLGGNTSLILQMRPMPSPFTLNNPLSIPPKAATISWSPTSMVQNSGSTFGNSLILSVNMASGPTWQGEAPSTRSQYFTNLYFVPTGTPSGLEAGLVKTLQTIGVLPPNFVKVPSNIVGLPPDPEMWYRNDWVDANGVNDCKASYIVQSRFDRYEVYSSLSRLWTTALDTEQTLFSFQTNTDTTGKTWSPNYGRINGRLLLAAGACDDYDNELSGVLYSSVLGGIVTLSIPMGVQSGYFFDSLIGPTTISSMGTCNALPIGNTGSNIASKEDIYGFTHDVANDLQNATGKTLFINDTGHSIHDERPAFFAEQIFQFLNTPDNNINITLKTGNDDARENSEVHALVGSLSTTATNSALGVPIQPPVWTLDVPLNYWFHPWPSGPQNSPLLQPLGDWDNPCGINCTKINAFDLRNGSTHNFTIALPEAANTAPMNSFQLEFFTGWNITPPGNIGYGNDSWDLQSIVACVPGATGAFVSDSFSGNGQSIQAQNYGSPGVTFTPPSFSPTLGTSKVISSSSCQSALSNPPPNPNAPGL